MHSEALGVDERQSVDVALSHTLGVDVRQSDGVALSHTLGVDERQSDAEVLGVTLSVLERLGVADWQDVALGEREKLGVADWQDVALGEREKLGVADWQDVALSEVVAHREAIGVDERQSVADGEGEVEADVLAEAAADTEGWTQVHSSASARATRGAERSGIRARGRAALGGACALRARRAAVGCLQGGVWGGCDSPEQQQSLSAHAGGASLSSHCRSLRPNRTADGPTKASLWARVTSRLSLARAFSFTRAAGARAGRPARTRGATSRAPVPNRA